MRFRLVITLALLLTSCGGDDGSLSTSTIGGSTTSSPGGSTTSSIGGSSTTLTGESSTTLTGESSTTTTVISTTTSGPPTRSVWERVPDENVAFGPGRLAMSSVAAGGPGLVAVGWDTSSGVADAAVWTSTDGLDWQEVVIGEAGLQIMNSVTAGGPGLVAVGYDSSGGDEDAAVWTSPDGFTWTRVPHDEVVFGGPGSEEMFGVAAGGPGLVAVGWGTSAGDDAAAVWVSADGYDWTRIDDNAVLGGPGGQAMYSVVGGGPGLVAVGYDFLGGELDAAVWTSSDGLTWSRVPPDGAVFGGPSSQEMRSVAVGGPGLVAVGNDYADISADAAVWTSSDGLTWRRVPHDEAVFGGPGNQEMLGVAIGSPGLAAVGRDDSGQDGDAAVWASADGLTWSRVSGVAVLGGPLHQEMLGVAAGGPGLVAVGLEWNPDGHAQRAAVWLNRPSL
jgi:hypothetical protein